ncbi:hypothetical protein KSX_89400 [Ktedonospora formicarum]|uniref:Uncharacterized protein n=1 Tax=Ktedonospora formicarum TaxID=2778364 RepID=A0A8J3I5N2_9CHLR|nr:hypothetical protein KSX_89400 [Ktedonospora formicarum]
MEKYGFPLASKRFEGHCSWFHMLTGTIQGDTCRETTGCANEGRTKGIFEYAYKDEIPFLVRIHVS